MVSGEAQKIFCLPVLHLNDSLFVPFVSTDCSSTLSILCGFSPVELAALLIKLVLREEQRECAPFNEAQKHSPRLALEVDSCIFLEALWPVCVLFMRASHDEIALINGSQLPHIRS